MTSQHPSSNRCTEAPPCPARFSRCLRWTVLLMAWWWPFGAGHPTCQVCGARAVARALPAPIALTDTADVQNILDGMARLADAEATQQAIRDAMQKIEAQVETARHDRDLELVSCLVEQRTRRRALLRVVTTATVLLREAVDRNDVREAAVEHRRVMVARHQFERLMRDVAACATSSDAPVTSTGEPVTLVVESPLTGDEAIPYPIDTILEPDLGTLPCW